MQITEHMYLVASGDMGLALTHPQDCNVYAIKVQDGFLLVDSGVGVEPEKIETVLEKDGLSPEKMRAILLTHGHADHSGGAAYFQKQYGAQIIGPKAEKEFVEQALEGPLGLDIARQAGFYPADYRLAPCVFSDCVSPGDTRTIFGILFEVYEAAGHSIGGVCYRAKIDGKQTLFVGDLISADGKISLQNIPGAEIAAYSRSVLALENVEIEALMTGHGHFMLNRGVVPIKKVCSKFRNLAVPENIF